MWEFSLNLRSENFDIAKNIYDALKAFSSEFGGVVTSHEENGYIYILIGCKSELQENFQDFLSKIITQTICSSFKSEFLSQNLILPRHDKIGILAFKKALLNFDRETDYYIIQKNLDFNKNLFLEAFYDFRLAGLKSKWTELVSLANENRDYLMSNESFLDLLKFLIDNLDIGEEEVDIIEEQEGYKLYFGHDEIYSEDYKNKVLNEEGLISSIIDLAPQKINLYQHNENNATDLLQKIFAPRINVTTIGTSAMKKFEK